VRLVEVGVEDDFLGGSLGVGPLLPNWERREMAPFLSPRMKREVVVRIPSPGEVRKVLHHVMLKFFSAGLVRRDERKTEKPLVAPEKEGDIRVASRAVDEVKRRRP
jgi:hypothetical protein